MKSRTMLAARIVAGVVLLVVLAALGIRARDMLQDERAQARLLVDDGARALAAGDQPAAVLAFERARLFAPRADFVRAAVAAADIHDAESVVPRTLRWITPDEWSAIGITSGWLAALALAAFVARKRRSIGHVVWISAGAFAFALGAVATTNGVARSVVTGAEVPARVAPYTTATTEGALAAGSVVVLDSTHGTFVHVRASDGLEGWVPLNHLVSIGPSS